MRASVGSFGSPLPKSITGMPSASSRRRSSSSRTNGYVAISVSVGEIRTARRYREGPLGERICTFEVPLSHGEGAGSAVRLAGRAVRPAAPRTRLLQRPPRRREAEHLPLRDRRRGAGRNAGLRGRGRNRRSGAGTAQRRRRLGGQGTDLLLL